MSDWQITPARSDDLPAIVDLLQACGLPAADLDAALLESFLVCRDGERPIAVAGLQPCGDAALLRSLAVCPACRRHGLANHLLETLERRAAREGRPLYLLTTDAAGFFARRGFQPLPREALPEAVAASAQARALCPASAVCMHKPPSPTVLP